MFVLCEGRDVGLTHNVFVVVSDQDSVCLCYVREGMKDLPIMCSLLCRIKTVCVCVV